MKIPTLRFDVGEKRMSGKLGFRHYDFLNVTLRIFVCTLRWQNLILGGPSTLRFRHYDFLNVTLRNFVCTLRWHNFFLGDRRHYDFDITIFWMSHYDSLNVTLHFWARTFTFHGSTLRFHALWIVMSHWEINFPHMKVCAKNLISSQEGVSL